MIFKIVLLHYRAQIISKQKIPLFLLFREQGAKGCNYQEEVARKKAVTFPYPVGSAGPDGETATRSNVDRVAIPRSETELRREIVELQARLHQAYAQIELSNSELVKAESNNLRLTNELKLKEQDLRKFRCEARRAGQHFDDVQELVTKRPRTGPALKAWEEMTPRNRKRVTDPIQVVLVKTAEERQMDPVKLSAEVLFRYAWFCLHWWA